MRMTCLLVLTLTVASFAQNAPPNLQRDDLAMPTNPKAVKAWNEAQEYLKKRMRGAAMDSYKKCVKIEPDNFLCAKSGISLALSLGEYKDAMQMADMLADASKDPSHKVFGQYESGVASYRDGVARDKREQVEKARATFDALIAEHPKDPNLLLADGLAAAHLKQDDEARQRFEEFLKVAPADDEGRSRVQRYIDRPELARARMAPSFRVTTLDGKTLSMDDLQGKVVLLDFWATWCGPCNQELPHVKDIVAKYQGRPLVVLSISWDKDEVKWKQFIASHGMTWNQYRDSDHDVTKLFGIDAIPHYFTIDTDGVLQSEQLGTGSEIDGKLKKMVAAAEKKLQQAPAVAAKQGD
jgi:peroxiredoxin/Flp pilus assembly protein TadD